MNAIGDSDDEPPVKKPRVEIVIPETQMATTARAQASDTDTAVVNVPVRTRSPSLRSLVVSTSANIRPRIQVHVSQTDITPKMQQIPVTLQLSTSQLQVSSQAKSPINVPSGVSLCPSGAPRYPTPHVITLSSWAQTSGNNSKPIKSTDVKISPRVIPQAELVTVTKPADQLKLTSGQKQISVQLPANWSTPSTAKSLLDTSKVPRVTYNMPDLNTRSLLNTNVTDSLGGNQSFTDKSVPSTAVPKTYITGNKVHGNLTASQVMTQPSATVLSVSRPTTIAMTQPLAQRAIAKGSPVVFANNKQYTLFPSNPNNHVVTQLVKTDTKVNKGKVTMAEAQIMLPTGMAKISWPIQNQSIVTENKPILISTPTILKPGSAIVHVHSKNVISQKMPTLVSGSESVGKVIGTCVSTPSTHTVTPTAKVVEVSSAKGTHKSSVLPAQKNWELVKQSPQLMAPKQQTQPSASTSLLTDTIKSKISTISNIDAIEARTPDEISENNRGAIEGSENPKSTESHNVDSIKVEPTEHCVETGGDVSNTNADTGDCLTVNTDENSKVNVQMNIDGSERMQTDDVDGDKKEPATDNADTAHTTDPVEAMDWKDGVAELPGSNIKFQMNDLGMLEVMNDDLECDETLNTSEELDKMDGSKIVSVDITDNSDTAEDDVKIEVTEKADNVLIQAEATTKKPEVSNKDEITQCENCSNYGFLTDFCTDGRFCSEKCQTEFSDRLTRDAKKHGTMSKRTLGLKKGRKKLLMKDGNLAESPPEQNTFACAKKNKSFLWTRYFEQEQAVEAPARFFKNPFPAIKNQFRVGMKLEGIDPNHQSKFCVLSVSEVCGFRIRLHFDGYSECFDFWSDIDSPMIFPVGFCEKQNKTILPPNGYTTENFTWASYLRLTKASPVPKSLFSNQPVQAVTPNPFRVGSKMEAIDKKNSSLICVASVADILGERVLVHFDSWEENYDYWCEQNSPLIHPAGYCSDNELVLSPPQDWHEVSAFTWEKYLSKTKSQSVPVRAFKPRPEIPYESGMKVEVVDKRNPLLVRVASIVDTENYMVKIHFDGWADVYDYWLEDDSPDIHPPGWCAKTGHPLMPPICSVDMVANTGPGVCPTPGCKGIGHIKGPKYSGHHSTFGCPYSEINMNKECVLGDRLGMEIMDEAGTLRRAQHAASPDNKRSSTDGLSKLKQEPNDEPVHKISRGRKPKSCCQALEEQKAREEKQDGEETLRLGIRNSVFATSSMISAPRKEVPLCWEQHCKLLPGVTNIHDSDVNKWTMDQVAAFVNTLPGCDKYAKIFKKEQIDGEAFLLLTQSDIIEIMNVKLGPALKIFNSIVMFKNSIEV